MFDVKYVYNCCLQLVLVTMLEMHGHVLTWKMLYHKIYLQPVVQLLQVQAKRGRDSKEVAGAGKGGVCANGGNVAPSTAIVHKGLPVFNPPQQHLYLLYQQLLYQRTVPQGMTNPQTTGGPNVLAILGFSLQGFSPREVSLPSGIRDPPCTWVLI